VRYWLGPWVWESKGITPHWRMPAGATSSIDLRSVQHCAIAGGAPQGVALFVSPDAANLGSDYTNLGTDPEAVLSGVRKSAIRTLLALPNNLAANTLHDAIWETLTIQSDPTGDDRAPPIVPTTGRRYELWLDGQLRKSIRFRGSELEAAPVLDMLKRQYRQHRLDSLDGKTPEILYRKILGYWVRKYGLDYRAFQPADLPDEKDLEPTTTITESFNTADSNTLGPDLTWTEVVGDFDVVSNTAKNGGAAGTQAVARAEHDLSSVDHYSQATTSIVSANLAVAECLVRFSSSADTSYDGAHVFYTTVSASAYTALGKRVAGVETELASNTGALGSSIVLKTYASGSTIKLYADAAERSSVTDTAITTGTRCGLRIYKASTGNPALDSFEAADLAVHYALTANHGSFTLSGQAAGLRVGRVIAANHGSFALSGQNAGLLAGRRLTANHGSYAISGQNAGLLIARAMAAGHGSFTLSGQDAALRASRILAANHGSFSLSGQSANLLYSRTLAAGHGSFALSGQAASLLVTRLLAAGCGVFTLTGQNAGLVYSGTVAEGPPSRHFRLDITSRIGQSVNCPDLDYGLRLDITSERGWSVDIWG